MLGNLITHRNSSAGRSSLPSLFDDRFFDDFFGVGLIPMRNTQSRPAVDIKEFKDRFVLEADLPGVEEKDVKVEVNSGRLVLQVDREETKEEEECSVLLNERTSYKFRREFSLGEGVDTGGIEASFRNGTLRVTLPKSQKAAPKVIPIKVKS